MNNQGNSKADGIGDHDRVRDTKDQIRKQIKEEASHYRAFFEALIEEGFTEEYAIRILMTRIRNGP